MNETHYAAMRAAHLVEASELLQLVDNLDDGIRLVDMRGIVERATDANGNQKAVYRGQKEEYLQGHIPGAVFIDWTQDIVDLHNTVPVQLAGPEKMALVLGLSGIGSRHQVIVYDASTSMQFATRFWWAMRAYGHEHVRVLNGGLLAWQEAGGKLQSGGASYAPEIFEAHFQPEWVVDAKQVLALEKEDVLLDARDPDQYFNRVKRGSRGGHIPGAKLLSREFVVDEKGRFLPSEQLQKLALEAGAEPEKRCVAYCNGGVAATAVLFALSMIGYKNLGNYDGSWNEWSERMELPVE